MKYAIIIPDGCADEPQAALQNQTPLQAAQLPHCDRLASTGAVGLVNHIPAHLPAGSAVANMSLLGYDPNEHFTGRAPLEAAASGIDLGTWDWAIRCNLVTVQDQTMQDFTAEHISTEEARQLLADAQSHLPDSTPLEFVAGVSYRNLLLYRGTEQQPAPFTQDTRTWAPHDLIDQPIRDRYPRGPGSDLLNDIMSDSVEWFADHAVNRSRLERGLRPATNVWLWGLGQRPNMTLFESRFGLRGAMITAVDLLRGLGRLIGWDVLEVPGATGYLDTDYAAKGRAAVEALQTHDIVCVHVEATDEASHEGRCDAKVEALEKIDEHIVGPLSSALASYPQWRILVCPDHPTPLRTKMHSHGSVPFLVAGDGIAADASTAYDEHSAAQSGKLIANGWELLPRWITESTWR